MSEETSGQAGGRHDAGNDFVQHEIWRLESLRAHEHPNKQDDYDVLVQRWERIILDTPLSEEAKELLRLEVESGGWLFETPVQVGDNQYTADVPMLPIHVSERNEFFDGKTQPMLCLQEEGVSTEKGGIARAFKFPVEENDSLKSITRIGITSLEALGW